MLFRELFSIGKRKVPHLLSFLTLITFILLAAIVLYSAKNVSDLSRNFSENSKAQEKFEPASEGQIIEAHLTYDEDTNPSLSLDKVQIKKGSAPKYEEVSNGYKLEVLDSQNNVIEMTPFTIPNEISDDAHLFQEAEAHQKKHFKKLKYVVTTELIAASAKVRLTSPNGTEIASKELKDAPALHNTPFFKTIHGDKPDEITSNLQKPYPNVLGTTSDNKLDVVFIGDRFLGSEMDKFHSNVRTYINTLLSIAPFSNRPSDIVFHYVDNTVDLGCQKIDPTNYPTLIWCDDSTVIQQINTAGVPYDKIYVIVDISSAAGTAQIGGLMAVGSNFKVRTSATDDGALTFVHELGHTLGGLYDEYNFYLDNGPLGGDLYKNCYAGSPPVAAWADFNVTYTRGCTHPNWIRSSTCSIMMDLGCSHFNSVSRHYLNVALNYYSSGAAASTPTPTRGPSATPTPTARVTPTKTPTPIPTISGTPNPSIIIKQPLPGATVSISRDLNIQTQGQDPVGLSRVDVSYDGVIIKTCYGNRDPRHALKVDCNTKVSKNNLTLGSHTITAKASDRFGYFRAVSNTVYVANQ